MDLDKITPQRLREMHATEFAAFAQQLVKAQQEERKENQLLYYKPAHADAMKMHEASQKTIGIGGGNGASKTETCLVDVIACATGIIPDSLRGVTVPWATKFRGPCNNRIVVESLTTTLETIILPKLQWWTWTGIDFPGGDRGHWGWVPPYCLIGGNWDKSYSHKLRQLKLLCRDPDKPERVLGESTIQFMSVDQDPSDFASGDFHNILHDEPPNLAIWEENQARTMRVDGRMILAMTWPTEPEIPVDWIFDSVYEPAQPGSSKYNPNKVWIDLWTTNNPHLDQDAIARQMDDWSTEKVNVRIYGQPIRFGKRVHPLYTDLDQDWCFACGTTVILKRDPNQSDMTPECRCGSQDVCTFRHFGDVDYQESWPVVFILDPHPRKPHMGAWIAVTPSDDFRQVGEIVSGEGVEGFRDLAFEMESDHRWMVSRRIMDPNFGASPSSAHRREKTWQDEFAEVGLVMDLGKNTYTGRKVIDGWLRPDERTYRSRILIDTSCDMTNLQFKRYVWDDHKAKLEKAQKQTPKDKDDDFPTIWKYFANEGFTFRALTDGAQVIHGGRMESTAKRVRRTVERGRHGTQEDRGREAFALQRGQEIPLQR